MCDYHVLGFWADDHPDRLELKGILLAKGEVLEAKTNATLTEPTPTEESAT